MSNPLIAPVQSSTGIFTGAGLLDDVTITAQAIQNGDWAAGVMGMAGTALSALAAAMDPFAAIFAAGVGWLIEHVGPLKEALDALAGNPDEINAHAKTWENIGQELGQISQELNQAVTTDIAAWTGPGADAYRARAADIANLIATAQTAAEGASSGIGTAGMVVAAVRSLVRDIIAQLVGHLISWALQVLATLGIAMAWVVPQVVGAVASTAAKIAGITQKLVQALRKLGPMLSKLGHSFDNTASALKNIKPSKLDSPRSIKDTGAGGTSTTTARSTPPGGRPKGADAEEFDGLDSTTTPSSAAKSGSGFGGAWSTLTSSVGLSNVRSFADLPGFGFMRGRPTPPSNATRPPSAEPSPSGTRPSSAEPPSSGTTPSSVEPPSSGTRPSSAEPPSSATPPSSGNTFSGFKQTAGPDGKPVYTTPTEFTPDQVKVVPLKDADGEVIGFSYPSKRTDEESLTWWAGKPERTADFFYLRNYKEGMANDFDNFDDAPWLGKSDPFYIHAHADAKTFNITVNRPGGGSEIVAVDGATHGRLVSSNSYFQQASSANPDRPIVYMSCDSAHPLGNAAANSSSVVHDAGHSGTIYAPTGRGVRIPMNEYAHYGVKEPTDDAGNVLGPGEFRPFPANSSGSGTS